jgi:hypothetical protein
VWSEDYRKTPLNLPWATKTLKPIIEAEIIGFKVLVAHGKFRGVLRYLNFDSDSEYVCRFYLSLPKNGVVPKNKFVNLHKKLFKYEVVKQKLLALELES